MSYEIQLKCPKCNIRRTDGAKYCRTCGSKLEVVRVSLPRCECGNYVLPGRDNYCTQCGRLVEY